MTYWVVIRKDDKICMMADVKASTSTATYDPRYGYYTKSTNCSEKIFYKEYYCKDGGIVRIGICTAGKVYINDISTASLLKMFLNYCKMNQLNFITCNNVAKLVFNSFSKFLYEECKKNNINDLNITNYLNETMFAIGAIKSNYLGSSFAHTFAWYGDGWNKDNQNYMEQSYNNENLNSIGGTINLNCRALEDTASMIMEQEYRKRPNEVSGEFDFLMFDNNGLLEKYILDKTEVFAAMSKGMYYMHPQCGQHPRDIDTLTRYQLDGLMASYGDRIEKENILRGLPYKLQHR